MLPCPNLAPKSPGLTSQQETLYLKMISEDEKLNTEHVLVAVKNGCTCSASVLAFVRAYGQIKPMGYSEAHTAEAIKAYGGDVPGLSQQEEEVQIQRMRAYLKLHINKRFSPPARVRDALSLLNDDVDKAEKFLIAFETVSQMGFGDVQVEEALLLSDLNSEEAIRYLLN